MELLPEEARECLASTRIEDGPERNDDFLSRSRVDGRKVAGPSGVHEELAESHGREVRACVF
jgi:hypothetical protein